VDQPDGDQRTQRDRWIWAFPALRLPAGRAHGDGTQPALLAADERGQRLPYVDFYIAKFVPSANTETVLFATGQTDAADISVTDVAWVERAAETYDFTIHDRGPASGISFFWFNQHPGEDAAGNPHLPPYKLAWFRNPDFRRAVLLGLDRPGLVKAVYFGRAQPLDTIISPANRKWHNPDTVRYPYDPEHAKALLERSGFVLGSDGVLRDAEGHPVEFELLASEGSQTVTGIVYGDTAFWTLSHSHFRGHRPGPRKAAGCWLG
jgi:peptide/nickel transport system substrate-binding protein